MYLCSPGLEHVVFHFVSVHAPRVFRFLVRNLDGRCAPSSSCGVGHELRLDAAIHGTEEVGRCVNACREINILAYQIKSVVAVNRTSTYSCQLSRCLPKQCVISTGTAAGEGYCRPHRWCPSDATCRGRPLYTLVHTMILQNNGLLVSESLGNPFAFLSSQNNASKVLIDSMVFVEAAGILVDGLQLASQRRERLGGQRVAMNCSDNVRSCGMHGCVDAVPCRVHSVHVAVSLRDDNTFFVDKAKIVGLDPAERLAEGIDPEMIGLNRVADLLRWSVNQCSTENLVTSAHTVTWPPAPSLL